MRVDEFELAVVGPDGRPLPEVEHAGKAYVVAAPGQSFQLRCSWHGRHCLHQGEGYQFSVKVDGQHVGVNKLLFNPNTSTDITGFVTSADMRGMSSRAFMFAKPKEDASRAVHNLDLAEGSITAEVYLSRQSSRPAASIYQGTSGEATVAKMPEGKKFFLAPSLTTQRGSTIKSETGLSPWVWDRVRTLASWELRYETAATLLLRGILLRNNPVHGAILDLFDDTRSQAPAPAPWQQRGDARPRQGQQGEACLGARVKREAEAAPEGMRVKRERQEQRRGGRQEDEVVDLTVNENDEVLVAQRKDELLTCDLTAEEDPQWRSDKTETIQL